MPQEDFNLTPETTTRTSVKKPINVDLEEGETFALTLGQFTRSRNVPNGKKVTGQIIFDLELIDA